jgi:anti-sigma factor RsiW
VTNCISRDRLVDLLAALDRPAAQTLEHLASCPECKAEVTALDRVRDLIEAEEPLPSGFVDQVMHRIGMSSAPDTVNATDVRSSTHGSGQQPNLRSRVRPALSAALVALLSGLAACVVIAAGATAGSGAGLTPLSLFLALVVGAGVTAHDLAKSRQPVPASATEAPGWRHT